MICRLHRPLLRRRRNGSAAGFSLVEAVVVSAVMAILAAAMLPVVKFTVTRSKEADLRHELRTMRNAIDEYKRYSDNGLIPVELGTQGYPSDLETLVEGVEVVGQVDMHKKFLRRIPVDPMTGEAEWGIRSYQDEPDSTSWSGDNVYDVYSLSEGVGLNGVLYSQW